MALEIEAAAPGIRGERTFDRARVGTVGGRARVAPGQAVLVRALHRQAAKARVIDAAHHSRQLVGLLRWGAGSHLLQCLVQFIGVAGVHVAPAGAARQALQLRLGLGVLVDVEAHDVGGEVHAQLLQFLAQGAGVGVAGFLAITHQDDRGFAFAELQVLCCHPHRGGNRRHALGLQGVHRLLKTGFVDRARGLEHLNVCAVALAAVAIGHQPQLLAGGPGGEHAAHGLAGDLDLGAARDLAPHGAGCVEHQHGLAGALRHGLRVGGCVDGAGQQCGGDKSVGDRHEILFKKKA